jgi:asparagine synthase (glutamine-hydrolysing)
MCSISGAWGKDSITVIKEMNSLLKHRGPDYSKITNFNDIKIAHNLLSIVGFVAQPLISKDCALVTNCEIYNWETIAKKEKIIAKNDSELLFLLLQKYKKNLDKAINMLNGDYAFAFFVYNDKKLKGYFARDIFGIKPLWYYFNTGQFYFASERKALPKEIQMNAIDLNPRILLEVDFGKEIKVKEKYTGFFDDKKASENYFEAKEKVEDLFRESIIQRVKSDKKIAILVSGGVDSSLIAKISEEYNDNICFYNISTESIDTDKQYAQKLQSSLNHKIKYLTVNERDAIAAIPKVINIIETGDPVKVAIALPFYFLAKEIQKDKIKVVLLGNGADSLFCGFSRFIAEYSPSKDTISRLRKLYDTDCYRDDSIFMNFGIEARFPYLDKTLAKYVISLPDNYKIDNDRRKIILRDIASKYMPKELSERKKKAIQYGSGFDKLLTKSQKENKMKTRGKLLRQNIEENEKLCCLFSGGKDSVLALHIMKNMNYKIPCLISIISKNKDSYMYHTPNMNLIDLQAKALDIPLIKINTTGKKEEELKALRKGLEIAKKKYNVNGVITGAIYSTYQRDRVESISDKLGLKVFSPLWHKPQTEEVQELIKLQIKSIIVKIAGYGMNKNYLGKLIDKELLTKLNTLNEKFGFNVAGEGGEYESFVIDCPLFKKKIEIVNSKIIEENEFTAELVIEKAKLENK